MATKYRLLHLVEPREIAEDLFMRIVSLIAHQAHLWHRDRARIEFVAIVVVVRHSLGRLPLFGLAVK